MSAQTKPIYAKPSLYAFYFETIKAIGLKYGYNIVLHGSMNRDLDLVAIPWIEELGDKDAMIDEITKFIGGALLMQERSVYDTEGKRFGLKPHGRMAYIININRNIEYKYDGIQAEMKDYACAEYYIDISILPH